MLTKLKRWKLTDKLVSTPLIQSLFYMFPRQKSHRTLHSILTNNDKNLRNNSKLFYTVFNIHEQQEQFKCVTCSSWT